MSEEDFTLLSNAQETREVIIEFSDDESSKSENKAEDAIVKENKASVETLLDIDQKASIESINVKEYGGSDDHEPLLVALNDDIASELSDMEENEADMMGKTEFEIESEASYLDFFIAHPTKVDQSYLQHMFHALRFFSIAQYAAFSFFVHAFFPNWFEFTGSNIIINFANELNEKCLILQEKILERVRKNQACKTKLD